MSQILSETLLNSFNIVSLERVLVASATLLHSKSPKAITISLNLSNPLAGIIELKGQIPYNATAFNAGGDILDYLAELTTDEITYVGGDCGAMANPYLPPIPANLTTLEQLFVWSALKLQKALLTQDTPDIYKGFCGFNSSRAVADIQFNLPFDYVEYLTNQNLVAAVSQLINTPPSVDPVPNPVNWLGAWDSGTAYTIKDAVQYLGSAYIAKTTNTNKPPATNPSDWDLWVAKGADGEQGIQGANGADGLSAYQVALANGFVGTEAQWLLSLKGEKGDKGDQGIQGIQGIQGLKGDKGDTGTNIVWRGTWNSGTTYALDDGVYYQGSAWVSKTANTNKTPDSNPTDWDIWVSKGADGINGLDGADGLDGISIDHITLTSTVGLTKTYTAWGDIAETINLGTFTVTDGAAGATGATGAKGDKGDQGNPGQDAWTPVSTKTSNYVASNNDKIPCDTITTGAFTVTLPTTGRVWIYDVKGNYTGTGFGLNNLTVIPAPASGHTIMGDPVSYIMDKAAIGRILELIGTDWRITNYGN